MSKIKSTIKDEVKDDYLEHKFHDKPLKSCSSCYKEFPTYIASWVGDDVYSIGFRGTGEGFKEFANKLEDDFTNKKIKEEENMVGVTHWDLYEEQVEEYYKNN